MWKFYQSYNLQPNPSLSAPTKRIKTYMKILSSFHEGSQKRTRTRIFPFKLHSTHCREPLNITDLISIYLISFYATFYT